MLILNTIFNDPRPSMVFLTLRKPQTTGHGDIRSVEYLQILQHLIQEFQTGTAIGNKVMIEKLVVGNAPEE